MAMILCACIAAGYLMYAYGVRPVLSLTGVL